MPAVYYLINFRNTIQAHCPSMVFLKSYREKLKLSKTEKIEKKTF